MDAVLREEPGEDTWVGVRFFLGSGVGFLGCVGLGDDSGVRECRWGLRDSTRAGGGGEKEASSFFSSSVGELSA